MGLLLLQVSPASAVLGSCALSSNFVVSLYLWKLAGYRDTNRDDTGTIQRRFLSALLSCCCSALLVYGLARPAEGAPGLSLLELLGLRAADVGRACAQCLGLTAVLFVGPLVQHLVAVAEGDSPCVALPGGPWVALRNLVLAPFTEEFVFRACVVRLWLAASFPTGVIIFCSPLCFALAHAHHFVEHVRRLGHKQTALMQVAFQVFYTSLFGMYSNFLLIRTGSTVAVILAHTFCNHQGFPDLAFLARQSHPLYRHRAWLGALYGTGVAAFCCLIVPITDGFSSQFTPAPR
mmetsp:Transcript_80499/g.227885  ORF Transcript_80499/g.227885 Transcript_80499/m.227885 type:complete len:291 (-) Transcript_80499:161-1033(-)